MMLHEIKKEIETRTGFIFPNQKSFEQIFFDELNAVRDMNKRSRTKNNEKRDKDMVKERIIDWINLYECYFDLKKDKLSYFLTTHRYGFALMYILIWESRHDKGDK